MDRSEIEAFWRHHKEVWASSGYTEMAVLPNGVKVIEVITVGRKSGQERSALLPYQPRENGYVIIASNLGADNHPGWWLNLLDADGRGRIRVEGGQVFDVQAVELEGAEREEEWKRVCAIEPLYMDYEKATSRRIPVVFLRPVES